MSGEEQREFDHYTDWFVQDPYAIYGRLRHEQPAAYTSRHGGFWLLSRYADVRKALLDWKTFTSSVPGTIAIPHTAANDVPGIPIGVDPPLHTQYRSAVADYFSRPAVDKLEPQIRQTTNRIIDGFSARGMCDIVEEFAAPLLANSLALFLRLPLADVPLWEKWARAIFAGRAADPAGAQRARQELSAYIDGLMAARKRQPGDDLFSLLTQMEVDGRRLNDAELQGYGQTILLAGREATIDGIGNSLWHLAQNPADRQRLIENPGLVRSAVDEFLRFISPIQLLGRIATRDVAIHGCVIRKGEAVAMTYASANRDEAVFADADRCVLDRSPNPHLAFGAGPHGCIGAHLARLDMVVAIGEWLKRIPDYRLSATQTPRLAHNGDARGFRFLPVEFTAEPA